MFVCVYIFHDTCVSQNHLFLYCGIAGFLNWQDGEPCEDVGDGLSKAPHLEAFNNLAMTPNLGGGNSNVFYVHPY